MDVDAATAKKSKCAKAAATKAKASVTNGTQTALNITSVMTLSQTAHVHPATVLPVICLSIGESSFASSPPLVSRPLTLKRVK